MVDRAIKVALLEGDFAAICDLGLPFSLSLQLQSFGLKLSEAMWTAKSSSSGFSVSLFWPSGIVSERMKTKKKRRRRKQPKASKTNTVTNVTTPPVSANEFSSCGNADVQVSPNKAQSNNDANHESKLQTPAAALVLPSETTRETSLSISGSDSESGIDLLACTNVIYEKRGDIHGVSYQCDSINKSGWTPVVGRRKKKTPLPEHVLRRFPPHRRAELQGVSSDSESSGPDEPLQIPESASVEFAVHNSRPGFQVKTRSTMNWTPIASRTRARLKGT